MKAFVTFTGNLGQDAKVVNFENGNKVVELSVATNDSYINSKGEKVDSTDWHTVKLFQKEVSQKFIDNLKKGTKIEVRGHLEYRTYTKEIEGETVKFRESYINLMHLSWV